MQIYTLYYFIISLKHLITIVNNYVQKQITRFSSNCNVPIKNVLSMVFETLKLKTTCILTFLVTQIIQIKVEAFTKCFAHQLNLIHALFGYKIHQFYMLTLKTSGKFGSLQAIARQSEKIAQIEKVHIFDFRNSSS